nr:integrase, catalytic region, zinc finger, CCHC-type, peptidase aspartic, catalytic [Tanacetum cinerariifolium]
IVLFIVDSGCSKHMTGNLKLLINFVEKFLGTVKFGNDHIAPILGYGDPVQGAITIKRVYYVKGLNHNLFSVGHFYDADLEVAFRKSTCFIRDLKGNNLLTGSCGTDLYSIKLQDTNSPNPICLMDKATSSQAWLWHRRLSHLNFDTINLLSKNDIVVGLPKLKFVKDHLCFSCELGKAKRKSFQTKLTPSSKRRLQLLHIDLCGPMRVASINGKRYVLVIVDDYSRYTWTYFLRDRGNLNKMKENGDECIFVGYSNQSRAYRVFNKITRVIMESIHVNFDELPQMASDQISSDPAPECQTMALNHDSLSPVIQRQANVPQADRTVSTSNELDLLFSPMFDELLNGPSKVVFKSFAVSATDAPNERQQLITPLNIHITPAPTCQVQSHAPTVTSSENINQAETNEENDQVADDEFINIFSTPVQDIGETSSHHVDSSNMHTFYQRYPFEHRWIKDHPLDQVIRNPSQSVRTRRQLESNAEMCIVIYKHEIYSDPNTKAE